MFECFALQVDCCMQKGVDRWMDKMFSFVRDRNSDLLGLTTCCCFSQEDLSWTPEVVNAVEQPKSSETLAYNPCCG